MSETIVSGGSSLRGSIDISGSKNVSLPVIAATVLFDHDVIIRDVPIISDVENMLIALRFAGADVRRNNQDIVINCCKVNPDAFVTSHVSRLRASSLLMGACLARFGRFSISLPGGCSIGDRPLDMHLDIFRGMGAKIKVGNDFLSAQVSYSGLRGFQYRMHKPSVGATENAMLASVGLVSGCLEISNCSIDPEPIFLANFLKSLGFQISLKNRFLSVINRRHTSSNLSPIEICIPKDRIEAGTYAAMAVATRGSVILKNCDINVLDKIALNVLRISGAEIENDNVGLRISADKSLRKSVGFETGPHPSFPSDLQPQFMAMAAAADVGEAFIRESVFNGRMSHVDELKKMGADILNLGSSALVKASDKLIGGDVTARDLRGAASLIIMAAASLNGGTVQNADSFINRGYENFCDKVNACGISIFVKKNKLLDIYT